MATPTFGERIEMYLGSAFASDQDATFDSFLQDEARTLTDILPVSKLERTAVEAAVNPIGGVFTVSSRRVLPGGVVYNGKKARQIPYDMAGDAASATSIHYANPSEDPAFYFKDGSIVPVGWTSGMTGTVLHVPVPTVSSGDTTITNWPKEVEELVVMGAALRYCNKLIGDARASLSALATALDADLPDVPSTLPDIPDTPDVSSHLDQIHTFVNTDEDIELAQGEVAEISARMSVFANDINLYQAEVQAFAAQVQGYAAEVGAVVQQYATKRDVLLASINALTALITNLQRLYYDSLSKQTGISQGKTP